MIEEENESWRVRIRQPAPHEQSGGPGYRKSEDEEEVKPKERKLSSEELKQLFHLNNLKRSTDLGMIDRGFPAMYGSLVGLGYCKAINNGHQITDAGRAHLFKHDKLLKKI